MNNERNSYQINQRNIMKIAVLPGDGIGPEIVAEAVKVLEALNLGLEMETAPVGGAGYEAAGHPCPCHAEAGPGSRRDPVRRRGRLEVRHAGPPPAPRAGHPGPAQGPGPVRQLPPAICYKELTHASSLKPELVAGLDILIIRELTGDIYFGQPRGRRVAPDGHFPGAEEAFDTMRYTRPRSSASPMSPSRPPKSAASA
jgi:3-isopropylmalate dehydrogenase